MKTLKKILAIASFLALPFLFAWQGKEIVLQKLGKGRIVEKDHRVKKNVLLRELHLKTEATEGWILYEKDGSLHDMLIEKIECIEFPYGENGPVRMLFGENKVELKKL